MCSKVKICQILDNSLRWPLAHIIQDPYLSGVKTWPEKLAYMLCCSFASLTYLQSGTFYCLKHRFLNSWNSNISILFFSCPWNGKCIKMIFMSKLFLIPVEFIDSKITIWPPDDISLIYLCWVTIIHTSFIKKLEKKNSAHENNDSIISYAVGIAVSCTLGSCTLVWFNFKWPCHFYVRIIDTLFDYIDYSKASRPAGWRMLFSWCQHAIST